MRIETTRSAHLPVTSSLLLLVSLAACSGPASAPVQGPPVDACVAATRPIGARIRVSGEFGGFAYDTESRTITLHSAALCSDRGAGLLFVELASKTEREKLLKTRPRAKRGSGKGDVVDVDATITKIEDGRFVTANRGIVR
jgi:hypothetical protein